LTIGVGWHRGLTRSHDPNEDSLVFLQGMCTYHDQLMPFSLFVIADGMGGHDCGQEASRLAMHTMMYTVLQNIVMGNELTDEYLLDMLTGGVQWANLAVCKAAQEQQNDMGTTLTAALVIGVHAYVVNVGDSRVYRYRANARQHLKQITRDHSLVAHLVETGEIAPNAIYTHPDRNQVYRCLGNDEELEIDGFMETLQAGDRLLLCSDGLWEMVHNPEIERLLSYEVEPGHACDLLVKESLRAGGCDNVSVIVARVPE
jgi:serine/threonine protein phosphatase PrpC